MALSFAPDRRSLQTTYYHFNDRGAGTYDKKGFSQLDTLALALGKIYKENFSNISEGLIQSLVSTLVTNVPISHHNLIFLAAANSVVYQMRSEAGTDQLTPELLEAYVRRLPERIWSEVVQTTKTSEDYQKARAKFKVTLLRYIIYIQNHIPYRPAGPQIQVVS